MAVSGADSEGKHDPASDIDSVVVDSLKALDPNRPIREADFSADFVYTIAKSLDEHRDLFRWTHVPFTYDSRIVTKLPPVPLHSGAERYYREVGYVK